MFLHLASCTLTQMDSQSLSRSVTWVPMRSLLRATNTPPRPSFVLRSLRNAVKLDGMTSLVAMLLFNHDSDPMTTWGLWVSMQVAKDSFLALALWQFITKTLSGSKRFVGSNRCLAYFEVRPYLCRHCDVIQSRASKSTGAREHRSQEKKITDGREK